MYNTRMPDKHIYHYKISMWLLFVTWGTLCLWISVGTVSQNYPALIAGEQNLLWFGIACLLSLLFLLFGILSLVAPLRCKLVLSSGGIEYHTLVSVYKSSWTAMIVMFSDEDGKKKNVFLISANPDIELHAWAKHLPWDIVASSRKTGVPVSLFGGCKLRQLITDINQFAPNLGLKIDDF